MQIKHIAAKINKAADPEYDGTFILSTEDEDRQGDIIELSGWDLANFLRNPVALWQHDNKSPIGKWHNIRVESDRLVADLKLASTRLAGMAKQLIEDGVLKAVSVGFIPKEMEPKEAGGWTIKSAELLEASLVSVPANQAALMISKSLELTEDEKAVVFDLPQKSDCKSAKSELLEKAERIIGKSAESHTKQNRQTDEVKIVEKNISERIKEKNSELQDLLEIMPERIAAYDEDPSDENETILDDLTNRADGLRKQIDKLLSAEKSLMDDIQAKAEEKQRPTGKAPAIITTRKDYEPGELFFRQAAVQGLAAMERRPIDEIIKSRYRNDKGLEAIMTKADSLIGTTTGTNWAAPLLEEQVEGFIDLFTNNSVFGALRTGGGTSLNLAGKGSIKIPSRGSTKKPSGAFVLEGSPIPVKEAYFSSTTLTPKKMGVIVPFSEELATATNNQIETIIRNAIVQDTAEALDAILLDDTAADTTRPAGLLNGVTLTTSAGATAANIATDVKTLMANFTSTDSAKRVWLIMNQARKWGAQTVTTTTGDRAYPEVANGNLLGVPLIASGNCPAAEVYSINAESFYSVYDAPMFAVSNTAVLHMEDTTPLEIVSGTGPTTADPVRSMFQTYSMAIRMILPVNWAMVRASMVDGIDTVAW